jgi:hypothetical protein
MRLSPVVLIVCPVSSDRAAAFAVRVWVRPARTFGLNSEHMRLMDKNNTKGVKESLVSLS